MNPTSSQRIGILVLLALVMAATRINHFAPIPDASWAVFFAAGFYLRGSARWAFPLLMALAVLIDFAVIANTGMSIWSHYCMSPAYWLLAPSYAAMWLGGSWLRTRYTALEPRLLGSLAVAALLSTSVCFLLSNGSFYLLSSQVATRSMGGWITNMGHWYLPYLRTAVVYIAIATVIHVAAIWIARRSIGTPRTSSLHG